MKNCVAMRELLRGHARKNPSPWTKKSGAMDFFMYSDL